MANTWLLLISAAAITAGIMLLSARFLIPQDKVRQVKKRIAAGILSLLLYRHDLDLCLNATLRLIRTILIYLGISAPAIIVGVFTITAMLATLNGFFKSRPLHGGETGIVKIILASDSAGNMSELDAMLLPRNSIAVETPALRIPARNEMNWRIRALENQAAPPSFILLLPSQPKPHRISFTFRTFQFPAQKMPSPLHRTFLITPPRILTISNYQLNWIVVFFAMIFLLVELFKRICHIPI